MHRKNDFEVSKNLDTDLNIILLTHRNICVENSSMMSDVAKNIDILISSNVHNYFGSLTKFIFRSVYDKIFKLNSAKPFFT